MSDAETSMATGRRRIGNRGPVGAVGSALGRLACWRGLVERLLFGSSLVEDGVDGRPAHLVSLVPTLSVVPRRRAPCADLVAAATQVAVGHLEHDSERVEPDEEVGLLPIIQP